MNKLFSYTVEDVGFLVNQAMKYSRDMCHITAPTPPDWEKLAEAAAKVQEAAEALLWIANTEDNIIWSQHEANRSTDSST